MRLKRAEQINPYTVLGVSDERADEVSGELRTLDSESQYLEEVLITLRERYDPESIVMGLFLGLFFMELGGRTLPRGVRCTADPSAVKEEEINPHTVLGVRNDRAEAINPYTVLGVRNDRAEAMSEELYALHSESQYVEDMLIAIRERYDPESIVAGLFLAVAILKNEGRLLPPGVSCTVINPMLN